MCIRIPILESYVADIEAQVVDVDVPLLIGLEVLSRLKVVLDLNDFTIVSKTECWSVPLVKRNGHAYAEWQDKLQYTESELRKMHQNFYHPATDKLHAIIRRAEPKDPHTGMYDALGKVKIHGTPVRGTKISHTGSEYHCQPNDAFSTVPSRWTLWS